MTANTSAAKFDDALTTPAERRKHPRFPPLGLSLAVDGRATTLLDISVGGLKIGGHGIKHGARVKLALEARFPTGVQRVETSGHVVGVVAGKASVRFDSPTYALMRFIVHYLAHRHGVPVHAFR